ncbi:MAG: flippase-like domain-containing protein [Chitinispirillales bacterium]|nr:flippase-like domain-containing protein [Chitinispirillales bacterium]
MFLIGWGEKTIFLKLLKYAAAFALAALGLYIFFRESDSGDEAVYRTLANEISRTSVSGVLACAGLTLFALWLRALRLRILLPDALPAPIISSPLLDALELRPAPNKRGLFAVTAVSYMMNNILPIRIGEAARVALLWKRNGFPIAVCIGSLLLEHALDIVAYLSFLIVSVSLSREILANLQEASPFVNVAMWLVVAAFTALVGMFSLYALTPRIFMGVAARVGKYMPAIIQKAARKAGAEIESNLEWTSSPRKVAAVAALTYAVAFCYASMFIILFADVASFGFLDGLFAEAFAAFGTAIPLAPGSVGTLHAVLLQGMTIIGMEPGRARAVIVVYHAVQFVTIIGTGLLFLLGMKIGFGEAAGFKIKAKK